MPFLLFVIVGFFRGFLRRFRFGNFRIRLLFVVLSRRDRHGCDFAVFDAHDAHALRIAAILVMSATCMRMIVPLPVMIMISSCSLTIFRLTR